MLKEAIEKIEAMAAPTFKEIDGRTFCIQPGEEPVELRPEIDRQDVRRLHSLDALVKMVKTVVHFIPTAGAEARYHLHTETAAERLQQIKVVQ